jgi:hypothetical protein
MGRSNAWIKIPPNAPPVTPNGPQTEFPREGEPLCEPFPCARIGPNPSPWVAQSLDQDPISIPSPNTEHANSRCQRLTGPAARCSHTPRPADRLTRRFALPGSSVTTDLMGAPLPGSKSAHSQCQRLTGPAARCSHTPRPADRLTRTFALPGSFITTDLVDVPLPGSKSAHSRCKRLTGRLVRCRIVRPRN